MEELKEVLDFVQGNRWLGLLVAVLLGLLGWYLMEMVFGLRKAKHKVVLQRETETPLPSDEKVCETAGGTVAPVAPEPNVVLLQAGQSVATGPRGLSSVVLIVIASILGIIGWILVGTIRLDVPEIDTVLNSATRNKTIRFGVGVFLGLLSWLVLRGTLQRKQRKIPGPKYVRAPLSIRTYDATTRTWARATSYTNAVILEKDQYVAREVPEDVPVAAKTACVVGALVIGLVAWMLLKPQPGQRHETVAVVKMDDDLTETLDVMEKSDRGLEEAKFKVQRNPPGFTITGDLLRKDSKSVAKIKAMAEKEIKLGDKRRKIVSVEAVRYVCEDGSRITGAYVWYTAGLVVDPSNPKAPLKDAFEGSVHLPVDSQSWSVADSQKTFKYYVGQVKPRLLDSSGVQIANPPTTNQYNVPAVDLDPAIIKLKDMD